MSCQMKATLVGSTASSRHTALGFPAIRAVSEHVTIASMSRATTRIVHLPGSTSRVWNDHDSSNGLPELSCRKTSANRSVASQYNICERRAWR